MLILLLLRNVLYLLFGMWLFIFVLNILDCDEILVFFENLWEVKMLVIFWIWFLIVLLVILNIFDVVRCGLSG